MKGLFLALVPVLPALRSPAAQDEADRRRTWVVDVVERVRPAVVSITTNLLVQEGWPFRRVVQAQSSGTGVMVYEDGFIITNYHVVRDATAIQVRFDEGDDAQVYEASVVSGNPTEDLALLKIEGDRPFPVVKVSADDPLLGEPVLAIGNAYGRSHTVSTGIVSGLHRKVDTPENLHFENLIQTDASINPGNSGGPLLNVYGELVGINTAMQNTAENIGFAIPVEHVKKVLSEHLLAPGQANAWLGFDLDETTMLVSRVVPASPAELVGIRVGDRLLALGGQLLHGVDQSASEIYRRVRVGLKPFTTVPFTLRRGTLQHELELVAWSKVDGVLLERLGLGLKQVTLQTVGFGHRGGTRYLAVTMVQPEGPAAQAELAVGDLLYTLQRGRSDEIWFQEPEDLAREISRLPAGEELKLQIWRDLDQDEILMERDPAQNYSELFRGAIRLR
ncbi:MAG: trypsin-like peptidase domain-containing protein [Planctomycetota bacterium]